MWFWLSLASAALGAVDIILNKRALNKVSAGVLSWAVYTFTIPLLIILSILEGMPVVNLVFWLSIIGSSITFALGKNLINDALKNNLISYIIPLTSFTAIFTYVFGLIFLGENIKAIPLLGLLSIVFGSYILNVDQAKEDVLKPFKLLFTTRASLLFLFALMITSFTAIFDKLSILNSTPSSPTFIMLMDQILMSVLLTGYLIAKEKKTWALQVKQNFWLLLLNSAILLVISYLVFVAYASEGPVALVLGIKRLQIFFALILGYLFLKDKPTKLTWIATFIMILGTIMIKLG